MNEHDLGEIDLRHGDLRIRLRKRAEPVVTSYESRPRHAPAAGRSPSGRGACCRPPRQ